MEEVYIGMLGLKDSIPIYDANQNRIKKEVVKILNAQGNEMAPSLKNFQLFTTLVELDLMSNKLVDRDLETLRVSCTLRSLNLSNNDLRDVPLLVENGLKNLEKIVLQGNQNLNITGCIQNLSGLKKLKHLDLSHTKISTIPEIIRKLQTLEVLNVSDTNIMEGEIPVGVFSLKNLRLFIIHESFGRYEGTQLEEFFEDQIMENMDIEPTEEGEIFWKYSRGHALKLMKKVKKLEVKKKWPKDGKTVLQLWLNSSMLGSLGDNGVNDLFGNMRNIQSFKQITLLSLCTNDLYQIPTLRHFDNLRQLGLCRNNLTSIPAHILSLPNLTNLYITDNKIEKLTFNTDDFPSLVELHLQGNPICRKFHAAEACLESRSNLAHQDCAVEGLKEVMFRGCDMPRETIDESEAPAGSRSQLSPAVNMYPDGQGQYPQPGHGVPNQYPHPQAYQHGYGPPGLGTPPMQRHYAPVMSKAIDETMIFDALDNSTIEDIDGPTEKNLRPKIETTDAWEDIADDLGMTRDDKDLLVTDSKKQQHKTLMRLLLQKWEAEDRSLGKLYRLLIVKGYKQAARILKDGVIDNLKLKGVFLERCSKKGAGMPPGGGAYGVGVSVPGQFGQYPTGGQANYGGVNQPHGGYQPPPYGGTDQRAPGPQIGPGPGYTSPAQEFARRISPPPSYWSDSGFTRKTSQPESSFPGYSTDYKLPDVGGLSITQLGQHQHGAGPQINPQVRQNYAQSSQESVIDYFGKRPSSGSVTSLPGFEHQNYANPPHHRTSVDSSMSYVSDTDVKHPAYRERSESHQSNPTMPPSVAQNQSQWQPQYVQQTPGMYSVTTGFSNDHTQPSQDSSQIRRGSEESDRRPCQSDDSSFTCISNVSYVGTHQQTTMRPTESNYPNMSDTKVPEETDQALYRKVLVSAHSTETGPPGFSDESVLRKELSFHDQS